MGMSCPVKLSRVMAVSPKWQWIPNEVQTFVSRHISNANSGWLEAITKVDENTEIMERFLL